VGPIVVEAYLGLVVGIVLLLDRPVVVLSVGGGVQGAARAPGARVRATSPDVIMSKATAAEAVLFVMFDSAS
jgi:hypothetical protein